MSPLEVDFLIEKPINCEGYQHLNAADASDGATTAIGFKMNKKMKKVLKKDPTVMFCAQTNKNKCKLFRTSASRLESPLPWGKHSQVMPACSWTLVGNHWREIRGDAPWQIGTDPATPNQAQQLDNAGADKSGAEVSLPDARGS